MIIIIWKKKFMVKYKVKEGMDIIHKGMKAIVSFAFYGSADLKNVTIPDSVTGIEDVVSKAALV